MAAANTYRCEFHCPNPDTDLPAKYTFSVKTIPPIEVDPIHLAVRVHQLARKPATLEQLANKLRTQFPGKHTLATTSISGVRVTAKRDGTGL